MEALKGKAALVVGGGRGLGRTTAIALAREGVGVAVAARTRTEIEMTAEAIRQMGQRSRAIVADVTDYLQVRQMVQATLETLEKIDILVNCQGESLIKPMVDTIPEELDKIVNTNLRSVYFTCQAVLPHMVKQKSGHIINISSRVGVTGAANVVAYTASKSGVIGLTKALAQEVKGENIKVNVICPSPMDTPMRWRTTPDFDKTKVIDSERVAQLIVLLASMQDTFVEDVVVPVSVRY